MKITDLTPEQFDELAPQLGSWSGTSMQAITPNEQAEIHALELLAAHSRVLPRFVSYVLKELTTQPSRDALLTLVFLTLLRCGWNLHTECASAFNDATKDWFREGGVLIDENEIQRIQRTLTQESHGPNSII